MAYENEGLDEILSLYSSRKAEIGRRVEEFRRVWDRGDEEEIMAELIFCLLTPQSRAKLCWQAVETLLAQKEVLDGGEPSRISDKLRGVRFKNKKGEYVARARNMFIEKQKIYLKARMEIFKDDPERREWLVKNVKGMGYKEASHFLRNIGRGEDLAILDRHILKNLALLGVIEKVPSSLSRKIYIEIEEKMRKFASSIRIPLAHLDLLLWCRETGEVFK